MWWGRYYPWFFACCATNVKLKEMQAHFFNRLLRASPAKVVERPTFLPPVALPTQVRVGEPRR